MSETRREPESMTLVHLLFDWRDDGFSWLIVDPVTDESFRSKSIEVFQASALHGVNDGCLEVPDPMKNISNFKRIVEKWRENPEY